jgi:hypothetical protein
MVLQLLMDLTVIEQLVLRVEIRFAHQSFDEGLPSYVYVVCSGYIFIVN